MEVEGTYFDLDFEGKGQRERDRNENDVSSTVHCHFSSSQGQTGGKRKRESVVVRSLFVELKLVKLGTKTYIVFQPLFFHSKIVSVSLSLARDDKERKEIVGGLRVGISVIYYSNNFYPSPVTQP